MHRASSPRILPREESCANFYASRATVPTADTAALENTNRPKEVFLSRAPSLLSSYVHLSIPACLHPSVSVKTSTKPLLPPCPSPTPHCISTIPPSKPSACSDCIHFLLSVHPLSLESDVPSSLHPSVLYVNIYTPNYTQCFNWPYIMFYLFLKQFICRLLQRTDGLQLFFSCLDGFTDFCL